MKPDGPHFEPGLIGPDGRLSRLHKGSNAAALNEQEKARKQSEKQFQQQMALAREQMAASKQIEIPAYKPASPAATAGADVGQAGTTAMRAQKRRFGTSKTTFAGESQRVPLGGGVALAA